MDRSTSARSGNFYRGKGLRCVGIRHSAKKLVIIDGTARIGKTHATKAWCNLNPGSVRYVECPAGNDDFSFYREIGLSLGVSVNLKSKAQEIKSRIEEVLRHGDLALVIDEAHYLWPGSHYRNTTPSRINWIMTALVNHGVAVALVTTPQFFRSLSAIERATCWTSDQFKGRIGRYVKLPDVLSRDELQDVARTLLPDGNADSIRALALYAESSGKYLGAMDAIADTAIYICQADGRQKVEFRDVQRAIRESVTPSDESLKAALASATNEAGKNGNVARINLQAKPDQPRPAAIGLNEFEKPAKKRDFEFIPALATFSACFFTNAATKYRFSRGASNS
jgi:AAA domain